MIAVRTSLLLLILVLGLAGSAQEKKKDEASGKTSDLSKVFLSEEEKPFKYIPVDPGLWEEVEKELKLGNTLALIYKGANQEADFGSSSAEGAEGRLMIARALMLKEFYYGAFHILGKLAKERIGTKIGSQAMQWLGEITQLSLYPKKELETLMVTNEFSDLHPSIQSFVGYHQAFYYERMGFPKWADRAYSEIKKESYWDYLLKYWKAVSAVARGKIEPAKEQFRVLKEDERLPLRLREQAALQYSRLLFEEGFFEASFGIYSALRTLPLREQGRIQLERAWTQYYLKNYSKALGILTALKAPYFQTSFTPEQMILEMIIYKELCYYEAVEETAKRFRKIYNKSLAQIRARKPLKNDLQLFYMAALNKDIQDEANLIYQLREEHKKLKGYNWSSYAFYDPLIEAYQRMDKTLQLRMDMKLEEQARVVANELLDAEEQVAFLEYTARLDALRIVRRGEEREYKSEKISYFKFDRVFWPVNNEFWTDESGDYTVLVSSRCGRSSTNNQKKSEKDLEREFK